MTKYLRFKRLYLFILVCFTLTSCKKNPHYEINQNNVELHYDQTFQFNIKSDKGSIKTPVIRNTMTDVGTIDENGLFSAKSIGTTKLTFVLDGALLEANVTVKPYLQLFEEPGLFLKRSKSEIKRQESRTILEDTMNRLVFAGENEWVEKLTYNFDLKDDEILSIEIVFNARPNIDEQILLFYKERFQHLGNTGQNEHYFLRKSVELTCELKKENDQWKAIYTDNRKV